MVNTPDELGEIIELVGTEINTNTYTVELPSLSYTKLSYLDENNLSIPKKNTTELWKVVVSPNPSKKQFFVDSNFPIDYYWLYNIQGQLLKNNILSNDNSIDIEDLDSGAYVLKTQNKEGLQKRIKIIKE